MNRRKVLVLGATGSMGAYLVPLLLKKGYKVDGVTLDNVSSDNENLRYINVNAKDMQELAKLLENGYDGIVDFMYYPIAQFKERYNLLLSSCGHYIALSSYRVYNDDEIPTVETSPRHIDFSKDAQLLTSDDYTVEKARMENMLMLSGYKNWTIVRPSMVFSKLSFPLCALGAWRVCNGAKEGKVCLLPKSGVNTNATITWSGDVAKMFVGVLFNEDAKGQVFTFATSEHHTWGEIARFYKKKLGLKALIIPDEAYVNIIGGGAFWGKVIVNYDRLMNRVIDNSKVLEYTNLTKDDMTPVFDALSLELDGLCGNYNFAPNKEQEKRIEEYLANSGEVLGEI
jgi:nucleoside-diphosphate-sugar epimerase